MLARMASIIAADAYKRHEHYSSGVGRCHWLYAQNLPDSPR
jgi:hypothetical protein